MATGTVTTRQRVIYEAQSGPQTALISCPIEDVFFGGARGGGKTYGLLGDWISHADLYREHARGIFFRKTYPELDEVQDQAGRLFPSLGAVYNVGKRTWNFRNGATLKMRYLDSERDSDVYQGHQYTWMAFDELTNWPLSKPIDALRACLRSGSAPIPKSFRASGNPGGVGHNWVKARYIDPAPPMKPFFDEQMECWRVFIPSRLDDNPALQRNDPEYWKRVKAATYGNEALEKAWRFGDWDIVAGGMFDDLWQRGKHVIEPFTIPSSWTIDRSFDWGSSKPYSVGWWAESDGTTAPNGRTYPRGSLFRINELYGWNGRPNEGCKALAVEVADQIKDIDASFGLTVNPGPADDAIWDEQNGMCIARDMAQRGVYWTRAGKKPGTRKTGWEKLRRYLKAATQHPMEEPGMFVFSNCVHFIRTVPVLPRDQKQSDDVDTDAEDHCLIGETLVDTDLGQIPIKELVGKTGCVYGSDGQLHRFEDCRLTRRRADVVRVCFEDGRTVTATPDHGFLTIKNQWVEAKDLTDETGYCIIPKWSLSSAKQSSNSKELPITDAEPTFSAKAFACIGSFGRTITARFQQAFTSIIETAIRPITTSATWNCFPPLLTHPITDTSAQRTAAQSYSGFDTRPTSGTAAKRGKNGTSSNTSSIAEQRLRRDSKSNALIVRSSSKGIATRSIVRTIASLLRVEGQGWMSRIESVRSAVKPSESINTGSNRTARGNVGGSRVVSVEPAGIADVYCLSVPGLNNFSVAGGIIVHNCGDETRYRVLQANLGHAY